MSLPYDTARCMGHWSESHAPCRQREVCARYIERNDYSESTPFYAAMCPGRDGYYEHIIKVEAVHDAAE